MPLLRRRCNSVTIGFLEADPDDRYLFDIVGELRRRDGNATVGEANRLNTGGE